MSRRIRNGVGLAALLVAGGLWAVTLRPILLGGPATYIVVRGDSMNPTYATGDLVILQRAPAYAAGDIVAYRVPDGDLGAGLVVVHRIIGGDASTGFVLEGDNNPAPDPWTPRQRDVVGRAALLLPGVGRVVAAMRQPAVLGAAGAALIVTLFLLPRRRLAEPAHPGWETWRKPAH